MIIPVISEPNVFLDFVFEKDSDEEKPKRKMKVINLKSSSDKRRQDFTKGAEPEPEEEPEDTGGDEDEEDFTDGAEDEGGEGEDNEEGGDEEPHEDTGGGDAPTVVDGGEDATDDTGGDENEEDFTDGAEDEGGEGEDNEEGGDEDFTDGAEDDSGGEEGEDTGEEEGGDDSSDDSSGNEEDTPVEALYKYNLYRKFEKLLEKIKEFEEELSTIMSDDTIMNEKYKILTSRLKDIHELTKDYMVIRFAKVSYPQSMLFYQRVISSINIILETLKKERTKELKQKSIK